MSERTRPVGLRGLPSALRVGARVFLRLPVVADRSEVCALRRRSAKRLRPWEPKPPRGQASAEAWFERLLSFRRAVTHRKVFICLRENGVICGACGLNDIVRGPFQGCNAGWWIGDPYEGHGYMRDALQLLLAHAFWDLHLHRVEANIRPENVRSLRTAAAVGFHREGYSPKYLQIAGDWCDHERWAARAPEWCATHRALDAVTRAVTAGRAGPASASKPG